MGGIDNPLITSLQWKEIEFEKKIFSLFFFYEYL